MANAREIQGRIKSIKDTMKITNAMYMVSSSKLQKARRDLKNTEPYFYMIQDSLAKILDVAPEVGSVYFDERPNKVGDDRIVAYLVITADKGLAGAYNHNVIKLAEKCTVDDGCNNMLFVVGQLGRHFFEKRKFRLILISDMRHKILLLTVQDISAKKSFRCFLTKRLTRFMLYIQKWSIQ